MNTDQKKQEEAVKQALKNGRNANDNFAEGRVDDYGQPSSEDVIERDDIKGGAGQHGTERNSNDNFDEESKDSGK